MMSAIEPLQPVTMARYVEHLARGADHAYALQNVAALETLMGILRRSEFRWSDSAEVLTHPIYYMPDTDVALSMNYVEPERHYTHALSSMVSHGLVSADWDRFLSMMSSPGYAAPVRAFFEAQGEFIATDTFTTAAQVGHTGRPEDLLHADLYAWTHSPVADTGGSYLDYLAALTSRRRRKVLRYREQYERYLFQHQMLTMDEILTWCCPNLRARRQYTEWPHALRQLLFAHSCAFHGVGDMFTLRDPTTGSLVACFYYVRLGSRAIYQGMVKDESLELDGIGIATLAMAIEHYCTQPETYSLDPTCVTQPFEVALSIDVYKRAVVNRSDYRPTFLATFSAEGMAEFAQPPYYNGVAGQYEVAGDLVYTPDKFPDIHP